MQLGRLHTGMDFDGKDGLVVRFNMCGNKFFFFVGIAMVYLHP